MVGTVVVGRCVGGCCSCGWVSGLLGSSNAGGREGITRCVGLVVESIHLVWTGRGGRLMSWARCLPRPVSVTGAAARVYFAYVVVFSAKDRLPSLWFFSHSCFV